MIGTKRYAYNFVIIFRAHCVEAHFHLHGTVDKNFGCSSAANPHERHQHPLYDPEVTVWCAVWSRGVTGPYFFEDETDKPLLSYRNITQR